MRIAVALLVAGLAVACGLEDDGHAEDIDVVGAKTDDDSSVTQIDLDGRYELEIDAGSYAALWISLAEGEHAGLVVAGRAGFAPYAVARSAGQLIASRGDQATLPMLKPSDVVVTLAGPQQIGVVIAGGPGFESSGTATVSLVALNEAPQAALDDRGPGLRAIYNAARRLEPQRRDFVARGALIETESGTVLVDVETVPLSLRSELNRVAVSIADLRDQFTAFVDPVNPERSGRALARLIATVADSD